MKYIFNLIILSFLYTSLSAQLVIGLDFSESWFVLDKNSPLDELVGIEGYNKSFGYYGYGLITSLGMDFKRPVSDKISIRGGLGYSFMYYLDNAANLFDIEYSSYITFKGGIETNTFWEKLKVDVSFAANLLAHRELQGWQGQGNLQKRVYITVNPGLRLYCNKNWSLGISTPITLASVFKGRDWVVSPSGKVLPYSVRAEITGITIGLSRKIIE